MAMQQRCVCGILSPRSFMDGFYRANASGFDQSSQGLFNISECLYHREDIPYNISPCGYRHQYIHPSWHLPPRVL